MTSDLVEQELIDWAHSNNYIVRPRIWKSDLLDEKHARLSMGEPPSKFSKLISGGNEKLAQEYDLDPDFRAEFERVIWTPHRSC